jgi:FkbM family methyltransferase
MEPDTPTRSVCITHDGSPFTLCFPDDYGTKHVFNEVFHEKCYQQVPGIGEVTQIIDIGANVGMAAAYFRCIYPHAHIVAFEPDPRALAFLTENAKAIGNTQVQPYGLSGADTTAQLFLGNTTVTTSLVGGHSSQSCQIELHDAARALTGLGIQTADILKVDTEGAEIAILHSLRGTVLPSAKVVYLEFHSHADRLMIDALLVGTHVLWQAQIDRMNRGQLTYVHRDSPALQNAHPVL